MNYVKLFLKSSAKCSIIFVGLMTSSHVFALEFECALDADNRFIRQELPGITHLCEVTVTNAGQERRVMWYANHDSLFCSDKTLELKTKYEKEWGFQCTQWPDHDGVDQLSSRHRTILDAELKFLIEQGQNATTPYVVEGLKAAASPAAEEQGNNTNTQTLVVQFFIHEPSAGATKDVTHVIRDNGISWNTISKIESLATHIEPSDGYVVNSALVSTVTDNGAMEIITVLDNENTENPDAGCYGNQTLAAQNNGEIIARTPHRFVCAEASN